MTHECNGRNTHIAIIYGSQPCPLCACLSRIATDQLIDGFAKEMSSRLRLKDSDGWHGWDESDFTEREIRFRLLEQVLRPTLDPIDIANYAAFLWHKQTGRGHES